MDPDEGDREYPPCGYAKGGIVDREEVVRWLGETCYGVPPPTWCLGSEFIFSGTVTVHFPAKPSGGPPEVTGRC